MSIYDRLILFIFRPYAVTFHAHNRRKIKFIEDFYFQCLIKCEYCTKRFNVAKITGAKINFANEIVKFNGRGI